MARVANRAAKEVARATKEKIKVRKEKIKVARKEKTKAKATKYNNNGSQKPTHSSKDIACSAISGDTAKVSVGRNLRHSRSTKWFQVQPELLQEHHRQQLQMQRSR